MRSKEYDLKYRTIQLWCSLYAMLLIIADCYIFYVFETANDVIKNIPHDMWYVLTFQMTHTK